MAQIAVVIPTCRRAHLLRRCLQALAQQTLDPQEFEVYVVDDGGDEATRKVIEEEQTQCSARVVYLVVSSKRGPAAARNLGWRAARTPWIAFTDDDCVPDPDWLSSGVRELSYGADVVTGQVVVPTADPPTDHELNIKGLETAEFVTANCFVSRAALVTVGGFDERFPFAWREDSDLHFSLLTAGCEVVHCPAAMVEHPVRPAPWGYSLQQEKKNQVDALLYRKHPSLFRRHIPPFPTFYYAQAFSGIVALSMGLILAGGKFPWDSSTAYPAKLSTVGDGIVWMSAACWLALTGLFAARRLRHTTWRPSHVAEMLVTSAFIPFCSIFWRWVGAWRYRVWLW